MINVQQNSQHQPPQLANESIYLRVGKESDLDSIRAYRVDPQSCRYIRPAESIDETRELVEKLTQPWLFSTNRWNGFIICLKDDDTAVGEIVFRIEDWECQRAEIGYRLSPNVAGKGVCTQAASLLIDYLFTQLQFVKLVAKCDPRNIASFAVMEKLGFVREAHFKQHYLNGNEWTDQYEYGLLASGW